MKIKDIKDCLSKIENMNFILENGSVVPKSFGITSLGKVDKNFVDFEGNLTHISYVNLQLMISSKSEKFSKQDFLKLIELSEKKLEIAELETELEYQMDNIGKYELNFDGANFVLQLKQKSF